MTSKDYRAVYLEKVNQEGMQCYENNGQEGIDLCPYCEESEEREAWLNGFEYAMENEHKI